MSGLEYLRAMGEGIVPVPPICRLVDFRFAEVLPGSVTFEFTPAEFHYNPFGTVHGGIVSVLLDSALSCAVHTLLPPGVGYSTLEIKVNFVRGVTKEAGIMRCEGKAIHVGRSTGTGEARLVDGSGKIYAHAVGTCLVTTLEEKGAAEQP